MKKAKPKKVKPVNVKPKRKPVKEVILHCGECGEEYEIDGQDYCAHCGGEMINMADEFYPGDGEDDE